MKCTLMFEWNRLWKSLWEIVILKVIFKDRPTDFVLPNQAGINSFFNSWGTTYKSAVWKPVRQITTEASIDITDGYPWRLFTPQESCRLNRSARYCLKNDLFVINRVSTVEFRVTWVYLKPRTEAIPAIDPIRRAPKGWTGIDAVAAIATPPASVAFWTCAMVSLRAGDTAIDVKYTETADPQSDKYVLIIAMYRSFSSPDQGFMELNRSVRNGNQFNLRPILVVRGSLFLAQHWMKASNTTRKLFQSTQRCQKRNCSLPVYDFSLMAWKGIAQQPNQKCKQKCERLLHHPNPLFSANRYISKYLTESKVCQTWNTVSIS